MAKFNFNITIVLFTFGVGKLEFPSFSNTLGFVLPSKYPSSWDVLSWS